MTVVITVLDKSIAESRDGGTHKLANEAAKISGHHE